MAEMVQTGTDLPRPPEPSVKEIAFKACCSRILVVMPGMTFRRPRREPLGSGHRPLRATRSPEKKCGSGSVELKPASMVISKMVLHCVCPAAINRVLALFSQLEDEACKAHEHLPPLARWQRGRAR